jgi:serine/threonine protein kinase
MEEIGIGKYGEVHKVVSSSEHAGTAEKKEDFAMKIVNRKWLTAPNTAGKPQQNIINELEVLRKLHHPNIV